MQSNEACPCCRAPLVETPEKDEDEEDSDFDDDSTIDSDFEDDESETRPDVELVTKAFIARGYDVKDAMSLLLCRYSKTDAKYTKEYISKLNDEFDEIMEEIDSQMREQADFAEEDTNVLNNWAEEQRMRWHEDTAVF
jgi:hypothetical protein